MAKLITFIFLKRHSLSFVISVHLSFRRRAGQAERIWFRASSPFPIRICHTISAFLRLKRQDKCICPCRYRSLFLHAHMSALLCSRIPFALRYMYSDGDCNGALCHRRECRQDVRSFGEFSNYPKNITPFGFCIFSGNFVPH